MPESLSRVVHAATRETDNEIYCGQEGIEQGLAKGLAKGRDEGVLLGRRATLRHQFQLKFGAVTDDVLASIESADAATLDRWEERILTATTLDDTLR